MRIHKIPKEFYLGPGNTLKRDRVQIHVVTKEQFLDKYQDDEDADDCAGTWEKSEGAIYLRGDLSLTRQWKALREELLHVLVDSIAPEV
jgi:hypothetical protein